MADRLLALVGKGKGPLLRTAGMRRPHLKVSGLCHDEHIVVETDHGSLELREVGVHALKETSWMQLTAHGSCRELICSIHEATG